MPFFRNGINRLDFQKKSERPKSQPLYSLVENTTMCYDIVTKQLHSLLVFSKEGILLEFYGVRLCEPGKNCYLSVTFLDCLNCGGQKKKSGNRYKTCTFFNKPLLFINIFIPERDFLPVHHPDDFSCSCRTLIFFCGNKILFPQSSLHNFTEPKEFVHQLGVDFILTLD